MHDSWTCLMVSKGPGLISEDVQAALKMAACDLFFQGKDSSMFKTEVCDGFITTQWQSHAVEGRSGILFKTQVENDYGEFLVNFLLHKKDLQKGAATLKKMYEEGEMDIAMVNEIPCAALYDFLDLNQTVH